MIELIFSFSSKLKPKEILKKDELISIEDIFPMLKNKVLNKNIPLNREYVLIEDHLKFDVSLDQKIEQWALAFRDHIYVRSKKNGIKFYKMVLKKFMERIKTLIA